MNAPERKWMQVHEAHQRELDREEQQKLQPSRRCPTPEETETELAETMKRLWEQQQRGFLINLETGEVTPKEGQ